jgi:hypothetical protein
VQRETLDVENNIFSIHYDTVLIGNREDGEKMVSTARCGPQEEACYGPSSSTPL